MSGPRAAVAVAAAGAVIVAERTDIEPPSDNPDASFHFFWTPSYLERPDGTPTACSW